MLSPILIGMGALKDFVKRYLLIRVFMVYYIIGK